MADSYQGEETASFNTDAKMMINEIELHVRNEDHAKTIDYAVKVVN